MITFPVQDNKKTSFSNGCDIASSLGKSSDVTPTPLTSLVPPHMSLADYYSYGVSEASQDYHIELASNPLLSGEEIEERLTNFRQAECELELSMLLLCMEQGSEASS